MTKYSNAWYVRDELENITWKQETRRTVNYIREEDTKIHSVPHAKQKEHASTVVWVANQLINHLKKKVPELKGVKLKTEKNSIYVDTDDHTYRPTEMSQTPEDLYYGIRGSIGDPSDVEKGELRYYKNLYVDEVQHQVSHLVADVVSKVPRI